MPFLPDELVAPSFAERLRGALERAVQEFRLEWAAVAELAAPEGLAALRWRAGAPRIPEPPPSPENIEAWLAGADTTSAIALRVAPAIALPYDAVLVLRGPAVDPAALAALVTCLERGLAEDRRATLARWVFAAVEGATDPIELTDCTARFVYTNAAWQATFGYPPAMSLGRTPRQLFRDGVDDRPLDHAFFQFSLDAIIQGEPWLGTLTNRTREGQQIMVEASVARFTSQSADFVGNVAVRRKLEHRDARETALMAAHHEFRAVLSAIPDGVVVLRGDRIYFVNPAFLAIVGRSETDVIRRAPAEFLHPDDRSSLSLPAVPTAPVRLLRPDGSSRLVEFSVVGSVSFEGAPATILLVRDTTDRRLSEERLVHSEKLSALGLLAAGVAHEINNPLASLLLNLELLRQDSADAAARAELLREAIEGASRIESIAEELRSFSAADTGGELETVDVGKAIASAVNLTANEIRHRARLVRSDGADLFVLARESPLVQVLVVVLTNAAQAIPEGSSAVHRIEIAALASGPMVEIVVSDTGGGIPPELVDRVFEPFAITKRGSLGTGLAIARRIIDEASGTIRIEPRPGGGTTVRIALPRVRVAEPVREASGPVAAAPRRGRVLVVDDDDLVARVVARILAKHDVTIAGDASTAAARLRDGDVDVVLCDLMMPDVPGATLYQQAVAARPELADRFIFMTGGVFTDAASEFVDSLGTAVLIKPFDAEVLRERVMQKVLMRQG
ncbi:MAG: PAS domain S-box protein [Myxococcales bacterium]|nr:PAS domain S-box protein [Myxococcales bacterium]